MLLELMTRCGVMDILGRWTWLQHIEASAGCRYLKCHDTASLQVLRFSRVPAFGPCPPPFRQAQSHEGQLFHKNFVNKAV